MNPAAQETSKDDGPSALQALCSIEETKRIAEEERKKAALLLQEEQKRTALLLREQLKALERSPTGSFLMRAAAIEGGGGIPIGRGVPCFEGTGDDCNGARLLITPDGFRIKIPPYARREYPGGVYRLWLGGRFAFCESKCYR